MSGSAQCPHTSINYHLNTASFGDTNIRYLEVTGSCAICSAPVRFRGPVGVSPDMPTVSLFGDEASLPFMVGDEPYDGKASAFRVTVRAEEEL